MNENMNIRLPNGNLLTRQDLVNKLRDDNIEFRSINNDVLNYIENIYTSYLQRNIISSRYENINHIKKYLNTKLSDILSIDFIEEHMPDVKTSSEIINEVMNNNGFILHLADWDADQV